MNHSPSASSPGGDGFARYRGYLRVLAEIELRQRGLPGFDASDVVQEVMLKAHQGHEQYRGDSEPERIAWLRAILGGTLQDLLKHVRRQKRDVRRHVSLDVSLGDSSLRLEHLLHDRGSSPSGLAHRQERVLVLAEALVALPDDQREVIVLRHLEGLSLDTIAEQMSRTQYSVASLLARGLRRLREATGSRR